MNYIEIFFGVSPNDLTYNQVELYFKEEKKENTYLEFKSFNKNAKIESQYKNLATTICAMLNSDGGVLIWGSPIGKAQAGKKEKIFLGELTPIFPPLEHDIIVNSTHFIITPIPNGISINIIENDDKTGCIYVFEIQKSIYAPHQTSDKYWMRLDGQTISAPHHYVEALMKRINYPNIHGYIKFLRVRNEGEKGGYIDLEVSLWNMSYFQNEETPMYTLTVSKGEFKDSNDNMLEGAIRDLLGSEYTNRNAAELLHYGYNLVNTFSVNYYFPDISKKEGLVFILQFAGKHSPSKISHYKLVIDDVSKYNNLNKAIVNKDENILFSEFEGDVPKLVEKNLAITEATAK